MERELKLLEKEPAEQFRCGYCGTQVPSYNPQFGICQLCELYTDKSAKELKKNAQLTDLLDSLQSSIASGNQNDALKSFETLFASTKNAGVLLASAMLHLSIADEEFGKRDYQTPNGYMEENSAHSKAALAHYSSAKALFFKAISVADMEIKTNPDSNLLYIKFLSQLRLGQLRGAKNSLEALNANAKGLPITLYSNLLYSCAMNDKKLVPPFEAVLQLGTLPAFYYYADFLANKNDLGAAKKILIKLLKYAEMSAAKKLLSGIERVQTVL
ncbi:MAG: hypothetical protein KGH53_03085 [Candidatus Micrarchaeota archaeon]|nr:hypothetical protein [Candidatus Micrarchaeota archaeon]